MPSGTASVSRSQHAGQRPRHTICFDFQLLDCAYIHATDPDENGGVKMAGDWPYDSLRTNTETPCLPLTSHGLVPQQLPCCHIASRPQECWFHFLLYHHPWVIIPRADESDHQFRMEVVAAQRHRASRACLQLW